MLLSWMRSGFELLESDHVFQVAGNLFAQRFPGFECLHSLALDAFNGG